MWCTSLAFHIGAKKWASLQTNTNNISKSIRLVPDVTVQWHRIIMVPLVLTDWTVIIKIKYKPNPKKKLPTKSGKHLFASFWDSYLKIVGQIM